jgi:ATP-dependent Clp protease ATP-binding subunit ClpC
MFERYTKKARRVIYFARLEASGYGSRHIETEHILLGLMRESPALLKRALGPEADEAQIRAEIEKSIEMGERFSTAIEVPLTEESKKVLVHAAEEADALGHRPIGSAHLLLSLLSFRRSRAARILAARGVKLQSLRERLASEMTNIEEQ